MRLLFAACFAAAALSGHVMAGDAKPVSVSDFQRTTFTLKEGAPERTWAMAQTTDGWLWFAGSAGLTRFDGTEFEKVDVATADGHLSGGVATLLALASGGLVIGHLSGGVSIYQGGVMTRFDGEGLHAAGRPLAFAVGTDRSIWGAFENGLMRFDGAAWTRIGADWNLPGGYSQDVVVDGGGTVWLHMTKSIFRLPPGEKVFERVAEVDEPGVLVQAPDGDLLYLGLLENTSPTRRWHGQRATSSSSARQSGDAFFDSEGRLWSQALNPKFDAEIARVAVAGLSEFGVVSQVFEDFEKNIWVAQLRRVHRLRSSAIVPVIAQTAGHQDDLAWINLASDKAGDVWFTHFETSANLLQVPVGTLWSVHDGPRPAKEATVGNAAQVSAAPGGNVWAAGVSGLWERQGASFIKQAPFLGAEDGIFSFAAGCAGAVWAVSRHHGMQRFTEGAWQDGGRVNGLPLQRPTGLHCDKDRNLWLGYGDGRVFKVDETLAVTTFRSVGPGIGAISSIHVGRQTLVGGSRGLAVLGKEGFTRVSSRLPMLDGITGIVESPDDANVWLNTASGLVRVWASDLESDAGRASGIRTQLFDASDGFPAPAYSLAWPMSSLALDKGRRVWFSGLGGLAFIDTARLPAAPPPPHVVLKALIAGGRTFEPAEAASLPEGTRSLEIAYTALRSPHPDRLRFRYRLDGVDDDWVSVEQRRRAIYTNLPPGRHRFQVDVSDELGSWAERPTTLTFEIPPTFVQSSTFKALCVATLLALLAVAYRLRVRHLERRHQQLLVERLDERERIARELHDTLLQGAQALIMKVHSATKLVGKDEPIHQVLDKALDQATGVMVEARNRIQDLRVRANPEDDDLPTVLLRFGQELGQDGAPRFEVFVEGPPRALTPVVLQEAGLIGREALSNAFQHARAATIELQIEFGDEHFRLRVRDDGLGFDDESLGRRRGGRHWGLPGMQERARALPAAITIWSRPGAGTEVELSVPGEVAYAAVAPRRRWSTLRSALGYLT